jgi:DNA-binding Lrp family transcriptional regulator
MANSRLSMRKILDVLRLSLEGGRSHREIARAINASPTTVGDLLRRAKLYGVTWPTAGGNERAAAAHQLGVTHQLGVRSCL